MHKNKKGPKLRPTISEKMKLRKVARKREKVPMYSYFHT